MPADGRIVNDGGRHRIATVSYRDAGPHRAIDSLTEYAFARIDEAGLVTSWNVGAERLFGYAADQIMGLPASMLFSPEDRDAAVPVQVLERARRHGLDSSRRLLLGRGGTYRDVIVTLVTIRTETGGGGYCAFAHETPAASLPGARHEIDDELDARTEDTASQLAEANARLTAEIADRTQAEAARHRLLRRLVVAQEEERRRIACDLHDDLGQRLTALRLKLQALETSTKVQSDLAEAVADALGMVAQIDQGLDFLAWELRPAALDELGLAKVLENYVREWSRHLGIPAAFLMAAEGLGRLAPEVEASVYRIAQEALNNVAKHAHARSVNVLLEQRGDAIRLVVEDDGVGFQPGTGEQKPLGLTSMKERAAAVGGTVELEPTPGGGTTVLARIPVWGSSWAGRAGAPGSADQDALVPSVADPGTSAASTGAALGSLRARLQELQQAVVARDEFIATVAHELRNPVAPLVFHLRLAIDRSEQRALAGEPMSSDWVQAQLRRVEQRLHRLLETLDRLLDVSRLSTGRIDLQPEPVDLAPVVREVIGTCEAELAVGRCTVTVAERHRATGSWDRVRLEQICRNLLSNAIRFGAGRPITVTVDADRDFATLEVRDEGVGIPPHLHTRIFERFERGMEQRSGGFGIGLWVVKNICVAMGGTISVESTVGEGACFTVLLPRGHFESA